MQASVMLIYYGTYMHVVYGFLLDMYSDFNFFCSHIRYLVNFMNNG